MKFWNKKRRAKELMRNTLSLRGTWSIFYNYLAKSVIHSHKQLILYGTVHIALVIVVHGKVRTAEIRTC
jgi:hypothetical protein